VVLKGTPLTDLIAVGAKEQTLAPVAFLPCWEFWANRKSAWYGTAISTVSESFRQIPGLARDR